MSWTLSCPEIKDVPAKKAKELVGMNNAPSPIKDYVQMAIAGLVHCHGDENLPITVSGYGHVCTGPGSHEVTTATIEVKRGAVAGDTSKG